VRLTSRIDFYDIPGSTVSALRADITRSGPRVEDRSWAGSTNWYARWHWEYDRHGISGCALRRVRVDLDAVMLLPRWTPSDAFDREVLGWWTEFSAGLAEHERGHVLIAIDGARDIVRALESATAGTCDQLANNANSAARLVLDRVNRRQVQFDAVTGHGRRLIPPDSIVVPAEIPREEP
jgi:predicted secreted Zn-dependent protease